VKEIVFFKTTQALDNEALLGFEDLDNSNFVCKEDLET